MIKIEGKRQKVKFEYCDTTKEYIERLGAFMKESIIPAQGTYRGQHSKEGVWSVPQIVENLKV